MPLHSEYKVPPTPTTGGLIPLHNASSFGHAEVVSILLANGADPNSRDNWNFTPLHEAAIKGKIDVCISKSGGGGNLNSRILQHFYLSTDAE